LIWDEFYHTWGGYPNHKSYRDLCKEEAVKHVRRRKHHPSVMLWCGGNEHAMGSLIDSPDAPIPGRELYEVDYRAVCGEFDPQRYYHANSPIDGPFPNDARTGDSHSYNHQYFLPGDQYPICFTENTRIGIAEETTMQRILGDAFWPAEGFDGRITEPGSLPLPPSWAELTLGDDFVFPRIGPVEAFFDGDGTAASLIDRLGASHALWIRREIERYRRGRPAEDALGPRRVQGHFLWKLNNTWPMIYSNVIDCLGRPTQAFYALARAYRPIMLSFESPDEGYLWLTNDSAHRVIGQVNVSLHRLADGSVIKQFDRHIDVAAGASKVLSDLEPFGMFSRAFALHAVLLNHEKKELDRTLDFFTTERRVHWPSAKLSLKIDHSTIEVSTDAYARRVRLSATDRNGKDVPANWSDNYFDVLPGRPHYIKFNRADKLRTNETFLRAKPLIGPEIVTPLVQSVSQITNSIPTSTTSV
jgi:hypothetical protein